MPTTATLRPSGTAHIYLDERGRGWIDDTNTKVIEVVLDMLGPDKLSPERIHEEHPHLSMAQIHAALAWYHDHKAEYEAEIEQLDRQYVELRSQTENLELQQKLRKLKESGFRP